MTAILTSTGEPYAARRGRRAIVNMMDTVVEMHDRGKRPVKLTVNSGLRDDMLAYFDFNSVFDGVLPRDMAGLPIEYLSTGGHKFEVVCE